MRVRVYIPDGQEGTAWPDHMRGKTHYVDVTQVSVAGQVWCIADHLGNAMPGFEMVQQRSRFDDKDPAAQSIKPGSLLDAIGTKPKSINIDF